MVGWAAANDLQLNICKTTAIIFGSTQNLMRLDSTDLPPILVNDIRVPLVKSIKNLGVNSVKILPGICMSLIFV